MSDAKYIVTGADPMMPLGRKEADNITVELERFLASQDMRVVTFAASLDIYRVTEMGMFKVGGERSMPFMLDDGSILVPISETSEGYSYTGFELWQKIDGQWQRAEQEAMTS